MPLLLRLKQKDNQLGRVGPTGCQQAVFADLRIACFFIARLYTHAYQEMKGWLREKNERAPSMDRNAPGNEGSLSISAQKKNDIHSMKTYGKPDPGTPSEPPEQHSKSRIKSQGMAAAVKVKNRKETTDKSKQYEKDKRRL